MEEVPPASSQEAGQFGSELPEPLPVPQEQTPDSREQVANSYTTRPVISRVPQPAVSEQRSFNTSTMHNSNLEATYDINTLPKPVGFDNRAPEWPVPQVPEINKPEQNPKETLQAEQPADRVPESEFDKRNERLRPQLVNSDDMAAAGMVALGDVLKQRQVPPAAPAPAPAMPNYPTPVMMNPAANMPLTAQTTSWSLYKQAIAVGVTAALIIAPIMIILLARH